MHFSVKNLIDLKEEVNKKINDLNISNYVPNIIAVSKTFSLDKMKPLLDYGHLHFGENKVQEASDKWTINPFINIRDRRDILYKTGDIGYKDKFQ